jgi:uncharacterized membrane protein YdcZ (DUF606 family)
MSRHFLSIPAAAFVISMYTGILLLLVRLAVSITGISSIPLRALAFCGEAALGIILLLAGTLIATRLAVVLFAPSSELPG